MSCDRTCADNCKGTCNGGCSGGCSGKCTNSCNTECTNVSGKQGSATYIDGVWKNIKQYKININGTWK